MLALILLFCLCAATCALLPSMLKLEYGSSATQLRFMRSLAIKNRRSHSVSLGLGLGLGSFFGGGDAKGGGKRGCKICGGKGEVTCSAGACVNGIDKKNGSILERFTCTKCKGFGYVPCKCSSSRGLTPEQSGER